MKLMGFSKVDRITHTHTHTHKHTHVHEPRKAKKCKRMTSLVAWWSKIHLPMQKTQV